MGRDGRREEPAPEDYLRYAAGQLMAAMDKRADAPASSAHHERSALLALQLERIPTLQEWNDSWAGPDGRRAPDWQPIEIRASFVLYGWLRVANNPDELLALIREGLTASPVSEVTLREQHAAAATPPDRSEP